MIKLLLLFLLPFALHASKILSYNIYDRSDRADVMITFDTPYEGSIKQSLSHSKIIIKLQDANIESSKLKNLSSKFLQSLSITPMSGYTQIVATVPEGVALRASKTSDAYGLRLRFSQKVSTTTQNKSETTTTNSLSHLPTKKDTDMSKNYYIVVSILILGILTLWFLRKKTLPAKEKKTQSSWLYKENKKEQKTPSQNSIDSQDNVSIRFQKKVDEDNSIVMLDFGEQSYLVLMGKSNILLDKFRDNKPDTQEDFESILQSRHQELDEFLSIDSNKKEPLQAYKERAASISYEV